MNAAKPKESVSAVSDGEKGKEKEKEKDSDPDVEITRVEGQAVGDAGSKFSLASFVFNIADGGFTELHTLWQVFPFVR